MLVLLGRKIVHIEDVFNLGILFNIIAIMGKWASGVRWRRFIVQAIILRKFQLCSKIDYFLCQRLRHEFNIPDTKIAAKLCLLARF